MYQPVSSTTEACLDYFFDGIERDAMPHEPQKRSTLKKQKCQVHALFVAAEKQGYVTKHSLPDDWMDECLPGWLEAATKCGTCSSCKRLWNYPNRSRLTQLNALVEARAVLLKYIEAEDQALADAVSLEPEVTA